VLGQAYAARGKYPKAERLLQESLDILEALNNPYEIGQTLFQFAILYRNQGRQPEANAALRRAIETFEELGAHLDLAQARSLQSPS
jgi:tetratricopeptide (TPR) repeat protein